MTEIQQNHQNAQPVASPLPKFEVLKKHLKNQEDLKEDISVLSFMVTTDIQQYEKLSYMQTMIPKVGTVLEKIRKHTGILNDLQAKLDVSYLLEALAATKLALKDSSDYQKTAEASLNLSLRLLWDEVKLRADSDVTFDELVHQQQIPLERCASIIVGSAIDAGNGLHKSGVDIAKHRFSRFQAEQTGQSTRQMLQDIEESYLESLDEKNNLYPTFFIRRMLSVMFLLGRVVLYDSDDIPPERKKKFMWIADLTHYMCHHYKNVTGLNAPFLWLGSAIAIDVRLKRTSMLSSEEKEKLLFEVGIFLPHLRDTVKAQFHVSENVMRESQATVDFQILTVLRALVRTYAKIWPLLNEEKRQELEKEVNEYAVELLAKAEDTKKTLKISSSCFVYVGKLMAAQQKYQEAAQCFSKGLTSPFAEMDRTTFFPWACYNYARVVNQGKASNNPVWMHNVLKEVVERCWEALQYKKSISTYLFNRLKTEYDMLEELMMPTL